MCIHLIPVSTYEGLDRQHICLTVDTHITYHERTVQLNARKNLEKNASTHVHVSQELKLKRTGPSTKKLPSLQAIDSFTIPIHLIKHLYEKNQIQIKSKFS